MADTDVVTAQGRRVVTPQNPLVINETTVTFEDVVIEGGEIIAQVATKTTFGKLTKTS